MSALEQAKELRDVIQRVHPFDFAINERCEKLLKLIESLEAENVVDTGSDSSPRRNRKKQDTSDGD